MNYYNDQGSNQAQATNAMMGHLKQGAPQSPSLVRDSGWIADRLLELHSRLMKAGDTLCGMAPTPIQGGITTGVAKESQTSVRQNLETSSNWIARLEEAVTRIENAL